MKNCNACGKCCENWGNAGLSASAADIERWETRRPDIARLVDGDRIWIDPATGDYFARCPWLQSSPDGRMKTCGIYADRPEDCRLYPSNISEMIQDDCEMLEPHDRTNTRAAQYRLDLLMSDSR